MEPPPRLRGPRPGTAGSRVGVLVRRERAGRGAESQGACGTGSATAAGAPPTRPPALTAARSGAACLSRQRLPRCGAVRLTTEGPGGRPAPPPRGGPRLSPALTDLVGPLRRPPGPTAGASLLRGFQGNAGPPRLREANRDGLLRRTCTVLPVADVVHLLVDELAGRGRGSLSFPEILLRLLHSSLVGHDEHSSVLEGGSPHALEQGSVTRPEAGCHPVVCWGTERTAALRNPFAPDAEE